MKIGIQTKIFFIVFFILTSISIGIFVGSREIKRVIIEYNLLQETKWAEFKFLEKQRGDTAMLSSTLDAIVENKAWMDLFAKRDKEALIVQTKYFFNKIKKDFGITHFYFELPDGICLLRVHKPEQAGDQISRATFKQAQETQKQGDGLELGATAFALRVVKPYFDKKGLVGYVELGQEISHFLDSLIVDKGDSYSLIVKKEFINHDQWKTMRSTSGLSDNWDQIQDYLIIDSTERNKEENYAINHCFVPNDFEIAHSMGQYGFSREHKEKDRVFGCGAFPIHDATGKDVGIVVAIKDITEFNLMLDRSIRTFSVIFLLVAILLLTIGYWFIRMNIIKPISSLSNTAKLVASGDFTVRSNIKSNDEIGELSGIFNHTINEVQTLYTSLEDQVEERTQELNKKSEKMAMTQKAMSNLLKDVSQDKKIIEEERARYSSLLQSIGDGVVATDKEGRIIYANKVAYQMLKLKEKDVFGKLITEVVQAQTHDGKEIPQTERPINLVLKKKKPISLVNFYVCRDATKFPASITISPIFLDEEIIGTIEVFRDITHEIEVDKAKTEFVSLASHQLRTPLSTINWYSEMLLAGDAGKINKTQKQYLDEIYNGNKRMVELVNSLLNVSRIELGTFAIDPVPTNIADVAKTTISEITPQIKIKGIELTENYDPGIPVINLDPKMTKILIQNLMTNAVKYTPEKGKVGIEIKTEKKDLLIKVSDNGYGIPKDAQDKIYQKLYRADNVREKETDGTGLGLYLVKSIVETVGGKIWFESELDKGTTFYITIPLKGMPKKTGSKPLT